MAGRRTKLTPATQHRIVEAIRTGAYAYVAAEAAGVHPVTFYTWLRLGEQGRQPYKEFSDLVAQARGEARADAEARVFTANPLAWLKATARDAPDRPGWTESSRHVVSGEDGGPVSFTLRLTGADIAHDA
jgi:hypothetical protein